MNELFQSRILATFLESPLSDESTEGEIVTRARRKDSGINSRRGGGAVTIASCADGALERAGEVLHSTRSNSVCPGLFSAAMMRSLMRSQSEAWIGMADFVQRSRR